MTNDEADAIAARVRKMCGEELTGGGDIRRIMTARALVFAGFEASKTSPDFSEERQGRLIRVEDPCRCEKYSVHYYPDGQPYCSNCGADVVQQEELLGVNPKLIAAQLFGLSVAFYERTFTESAKVLRRGAAMLHRLAKERGD